MSKDRGIRARQCDETEVKSRLEYDYSKLRGRMVEKCGSQFAFAKKFGISSTILSQKMNNKTSWSQDDIVKTLEILDIPLEQAGDYFLVRK